MKPSEICRDKQPRRGAIRNHRDPQGEPDLNGIDYVEVSDDQYTLTVYFLDKAPEDITVANVRIDGGRRIRNIRVTDVRLCRIDEPERDDCMHVTVDKRGDFSLYTLRLVQAGPSGQPGEEPLVGMDPRYAQAEFSFKAHCPSDLDCLAEDTCPPERLPEPEINYLAKDYGSFRQLILDRLALIMPDWQERHAPDVGIALVEILAYTGDYLSYFQDAVVTEAYLETARQRLSVRRHARLVGYAMHEGCNARAWVFVELKSDIGGPLDPKDFYFITGHNNALSVSDPVLWSGDLESIPPDQYEVFEPVFTSPVSLSTAHNEIHFYTWGDRECCLPRGATAATLRDEWVHAESPIPSYPPSYQTSAYPQGPPPRPYSPPAPPEPRRKLHLQKDDILIFEEKIDPKTGEREDADPTHRHVVRLTKVELSVDALYNQPVVEIEWAAADALPFPLCISSIGRAPECKYLEPVSVARGNIVLVDHGRHISDESLGTVPEKEMKATCSEHGCPPEIVRMPGPFGPRLRGVPLTFRQPLLSEGPAYGMLLQDPREALPQVWLTSRRASAEDQPSYPSPPLSQAGGDVSTDIAWTARPELLGSESSDYHFVVEIDNEGRARLRFGDGDLGRAPEAGMRFTATYRVGNGPSGNVGVDAIAHLVFRQRQSGIFLTRVRNLLPAQGGTPSEPMSEVKLFAPHAFRTRLQRAITADDYARLAEKNPKVQRAAATMRWTGSWYAVEVAIDPLGSEEPDARLLGEILESLYAYRRIGHDLTVKPARYVPLEIAMTVCVLPHYLRGHVEAALLDLFSNRARPDGRLGFFHPDNLTFGEGIYLSKLVAAAQAVPGVESVLVTKLNRLHQDPNQELRRGVLPLGPLEIAQLDNDPSFPEHGKFILDMRGGR